MSNKTVYIIGAGASKEVGLPTGNELITQISNLIDIKFDEWGNTQISGDFEICDAFRQLADKNIDDINVNTYLYKSWQIRDALPLAPSIDNYIDSHREDSMVADICKIAIIKAISESERNSRLFFEEDDRKNQFNFNTISDTWYTSFFQIITENCNKNELKARFQSIDLIIFNYDRCIEHFLYTALKKYYELSNEEALDIIGKLNIYHPYGSIGKLEWQDINNGTKYGAKTYSSQLIDITNKINTFTEGIDPNESNINQIRANIKNTTKLVFIGFAFHKLNMELLTPEYNSEDNNKYYNPSCYATTYDISSNDQEIITNQIRSLYNAPISPILRDLKCVDFFKDFWRTLSFN